MIGKNFYISQFPEALFEVTNKDRFKEKVSLGFDICKKTNIVFCGMCRDINNLLETSLARVYKTCSFFNEHRILILENDSTDGTSERLSELVDGNDKVKLINPVLEDKKYYRSEGDEATSFDRVAKMATIRNLYLDEIQNYENIDYVIIADLDIEGGWSYEGLLSSFGYDGWSAMTSNGIKLRNELNKGFLFFDTWTFRELGVDKFEGYLKYDSLQFQKGEEPVEVNSNFGGFGIYRYKDILNCEYRPFSQTEDVCCEHVSLHEQMRYNGGKIFINPSLTALYSPTEYS